MRGLGPQTGQPEARVTEGGWWGEQGGRKRQACDTVSAPKTNILKPNCTQPQGDDAIWALLPALS